MATTKKKTVKKSVKKAAKSATKTVAKRAKRVVAEPELPHDEEAARAAAGKSLVIVESPAKAKTIGKYLGAGYAVKATVGHIRDLPVKHIGIDIEHGFTPQYVTIPGKEKTVAELKSAAKTAKAPKTEAAEASPEPASPQLKKRVRKSGDESIR